MSALSAVYAPADANKLTTGQLPDVLSLIETLGIPSYRHVQCG